MIFERAQSCLSILSFGKISRKSIEFQKCEISQVLFDLPVNRYAQIFQNLTDVYFSGCAPVAFADFFVVGGRHDLYNPIKPTGSTYCQIKLANIVRRYDEDQGCTSMDTRELWQHRSRQ